MAIFSAIAGAISSVVSGVTGAIGSAAGAIGASGLGGLGGALSGVAGVAGTAVSALGQAKAARAARQAEALRQRQMNLEAARARRQTVRQAIIARGQALTTASAQGASEGSGIAGGTASITAQAGQNVQATNQNQNIGAGIFSANRDIASGQTMASIGGAIQGFGQTLAQNYDVNRRVFA